IPMSSTTMSSARVMRAMTLLTEPSTAALPMAAVRDSRVNHATRMPASMTLWARASTKWVLPVPDGPERARFSARWTHSSVARAVQPDMRDDPPTTIDGLSDLHGRRSRGRPYPPNPRHAPHRRAPISASKQPPAHPSRPVSERRRPGTRRADQTQVHLPCGRRTLLCVGAGTLTYVALVLLV